MGKKRGAKRKVNYGKVVEFKKQHPDMPQWEIAEHFGITQCVISAILRQAGIKSVRRGRTRPLEASADEPSYWEKRLHDLGLGMERGLRINNKRIFYAEDPRKEQIGDYSVTLEAA